MSEVKYIGMDFETGGTDSSVHPGLTAYFCALDENLNVLDELELKIKPDDKYVVEQEALKINGINLEKHLLDPQTISMKEAGEKLIDFLSRSTKKDNKSKAKPLALGHNVSFDIGFVLQLITKKQWGDFVHYGNICTFSMSTGLKDAGLLPASVGKLESLAKHFGIKQEKAHTAKEDTLVMVAVYGKIRDMLKSLASSDSGALAMDTLSMLEK